MQEQAFVMLTVDPGAEGAVIDSLKKMRSVKEVHFLYGPYDVCAKVEAKSGDLDGGVVDSIRLLKGVRATVTCIIAD